MLPIALRQMAWREKRPYFFVDSVLHSPSMPESLEHSQLCWVPRLFKGLACVLNLLVADLQIFAPCIEQDRTFVFRI